MKNLSLKQIEQVKKIDAFTHLKLHGNTKKVGSLSVQDFKTIVAKKYNRKVGNYATKSGKIIYSFDYKKQQLGYAERLRELINYNQQFKGSNYFKILIEGNTGIYLAHPVYQHSDYNKTRIFDKTPYTLKLMHIFNIIATKNN